MGLVAFVDTDMEVQQCMQSIVALTYVPIESVNEVLESHVLVKAALIHEREQLKTKRRSWLGLPWLPP